MRESTYQTKLIKRLRKEFPRCLVLKNDSTYKQGIPDLIVLYKDIWFMLEVKTSEDSPTQPNQEYYVDMLNRMSFAAFIWPENEEEVFFDLQRAFKSSRSTRLSERF